MIANTAFGPIYKYTKGLMVALGYRDKMTRLHSERVLLLSEALGATCGLSRQELFALKIGAAFHDIGKIGIADRVLLKPGQLDEAEWESMRQHSDIGQQILLSTGLAGAEKAALAIRHHHEHFDGGGYPDRLAGDGIPIAARIIAIADSYDAMAVTRAYHAARGHAEIIAIMRAESGVKHDPQLLQQFFAIIEGSPLKAADRY
jgi:HD-GYP domain-containing protein (c-di-GMP phosphodiesterase class II)